METKECIEFRGALDTNGYGMMTINKKQISAHRLSYRLFKGTIKPSLQVDQSALVNFVVPENYACVIPTF